MVPLSYFNRNFSISSLFFLKKFSSLFYNYSLRIFTFYVYFFSKNHLKIYVLVIS